jgi:hypothetical protein
VHVSYDRLQNDKVPAVVSRFNYTSKFYLQIVLVFLCFVWFSEHTAVISLHHLALFYDGDGLCSLCGAEDLLQFMFIVFNNIGLHQYAYIEASVHGHEIFKIGLHIFFFFLRNLTPYFAALALRFHYVY